MNTNNAHLIIYADGSEFIPLEEAHFFSGQGKNIFWFTDTPIDTDFLEKLVFSVARKPRRLIAHLQRIYYCFIKNLTEQLYAAIVDFLIILNGRGRAISWRVVLGTKTVLTEEQFLVLSSYLKGKGSPVLLSGNQYSIFSKGLRGVNGVVKQIDQVFQFDYDPLELARDHIEYSQLEEAKHVLEKAILIDPVRIELQHELIDLYQLTQDVTGYGQMLARLVQAGINTDEWIRLDNYFKGRDSNG